MLLCVANSRLVEHHAMDACGWNDKLFFFFAYALFIVLHLAFAKMKMGLA
jgi:hypothetical protein